MPMSQLEKIIDSVTPGNPIVKKGFGHTVTFLAWEGDQELNPGCDFLFDGKKVSINDKVTMSAYSQWVKDMGLNKDHNCMENAVQYESDGALGHGWECGVCGEFLQAG